MHRSSSLLDYYARGGWQPIDEDGEPISGRTCQVERNDLWQALINHLRDDSEHAETIGLIRQAVREWNERGEEPLQIGSADIFLAHQIAFGETMVFANVIGGEIGLLAQAVPEYSVFASSQQSTSNVQNVGQWLKSAVSFIVKGFQSVNQWIGTHAEGPAMYYKVTLYAPYIYGLVQMVLLALFPVAAFWALWPGHWKVLLNFAKVFVSVKLWVVFWSALAAFNQARYDLVLGNDPATNGIGNAVEIFPAIAAMYLLTPLLSFMIVSMATSAGMIALQGLVPHANTIGGLRELHREYNEVKGDVSGVVNQMRTAGSGGSPADAFPGGRQMSSFFSSGEEESGAAPSGAGGEPPPPPV